MLTLKNLVVVIMVILMSFSVTSCGGGGEEVPPINNADDTTIEDNDDWDTGDGDLNKDPVIITEEDVMPVEELSIFVDNLSPPAKNIPLSTDGFVDAVSVTLNNPTDVDTNVVINSVSTGVKGEITEWIDSIQIIDDEGDILGTTTLSDWRGYFHITVNIPAKSKKRFLIQVTLKNSYHLTNWAEKIKFGFTADDISSSQPITGLPVWGNSLYIEKGNLLYPCPMAVCSYNLEVAEQTILWGQDNMYPEIIVPSREEGVVTFVGGNLGGIHSLSSGLIIAGNDYWGDDSDCSEWPNSYDLTEKGDISVISSNCDVIGEGEKTDIALVKTDGSGEWIRVTDDIYTEYSPVIASPGGIDSKTLTVLFISDKSGEKDIWRKCVNLGTEEVSDDILVASNVIVSEGFFFTERSISVSVDYSKLIFSRMVDGIPHLFLNSIDGGSEINLGEGSIPRWATDGSDRILFTFSGNLWIMDSDGSNRRRAPIPDNLESKAYNGIDRIVFSSENPLIP